MKKPNEIQIADALKGFSPKVRKRESYKSFKEVYEWLKTNPPPDKILEKIYDMIDSRHGFYSNKVADAGWESIQLIFAEDGINYGN